jgi:hypothetical protein
MWRLAPGPARPVAVQALSEQLQAALNGPVIVEQDKSIWLIVGAPVRSSASSRSGCAGERHQPQGDRSGDEPT